MDGPWSDEAERRYREGGFDGVSIMTGRKWAPSNLEFLFRLGGIRFFSVRSRIKNDLAAFKVPTLEELTLATGSRLPVPEEIQPVLRKLVLTDRPGLGVADHWPALESLRLGTWRGDNLHTLDEARNIVNLYVEGRRQSGVLDGLQSCQRIEYLVSVNYSIRDTAPLRDLKVLSEVRLMAAPPAEPHGRVDFSDLLSSHLKKLWISNASRIWHAEALLEMPMLREIRLVGCRLAPTDHRVLQSLPTRVLVQIVES